MSNKGKIVHVKAMKAYRGVQRLIQSLLTSTLGSQDGGEPYTMACMPAVPTE